MIGFTAIGRPVEVEIRLYAAPMRKPLEPSSLVTFAQQGNDVALLIGNIYYQYDLQHGLQHNECSQTERCATIALEEGGVINAAALALFAYHHRGLAALELLEGDFALVIWDSEKSCFVGMRDPLGGYPLFWTEHGECVSFSTSIWSLLSLQPQISLNEEYCADFLAMPAIRQEVASELCMYTGIRRVLPGTMVKIGLSPCKVERRAYWNWLAHIDDPETDSVSGLAERYKPLLYAAVRERLCGRVASHFSGGMDSTSIALLAQDQLRQRRTEATLHAISLVYHRLPALARENDYTNEASRCEQAMMAHQVRGDDLLDFASFLDAPPHEEPYAGLWGLEKERAMVEVASQFGATTLLTGLGADEIHDMHPFYLTDLLLHGHLWQAWQEAGRWANANHCSPWTMLLPFGIAGLPITMSVGNSIQRYQRRSSMRLNQQTDWTVPPWILPDFVRRYALWDRVAINAHHMYRLCPSTDLSVTIHAIQNRVGDVLRWSVATPSGIAIAHPFLDLRLLAFGLGMHARLQPVPGRKKPVLAEAMHGILPENIRLRQRKGHFNEVYYLGLTRHLPILEALVQQTPLLADVEIFDKEMLLKCLKDASMASANPRQLQRMNSTLAMIQWFSKQGEWQQTTPTPSYVVHVCRL